MFPNYSLVRAECHNNHSMHFYLRQTKPNILLFLISTLTSVIRVIVNHFYNDCMRCRFYATAHSLFYRVLLSSHQRHNKQNDILYGIFLTDILGIWKFYSLCPFIRIPLCSGTGGPVTETGHSRASRTHRPPCAFFSVRTTNGRATRGFSNFFFFILFGCAAVFLVKQANVRKPTPSRRRGCLR